MAVTDIYPQPNGTIWGMDSYITYIVSVESMFFVVLLAVIWIIIFVATKSYSSSRAFTYASFISFILAVPITLMGWMATKFMYLALLFLAIGLIWIRVGDSYY